MRAFRISLFSLCLMAILGGCNQNPAEEEAIKPINFSDSAEEILSQLSLEEKVGQLFMIGFYGPTPDYYLNKMLKVRNIGGVILMKYNLDDEKQVLKLLHDIQGISMAHHPAIPPFISVDQEGGLVSRLNFPGIRQLTAQTEIKNADQAYKVALERGQELKNLGIHINYSPVVEFIQDTSSFLSKRVFKVDSSMQIPGLAIPMLKGYHEAGIIGVPKHFPGHTDLSVDSHEGLPVEDLDRESIQPLLDIYREVLAAEPQIIMTSHVMYPALDSLYPATLSEEVLGLLRNELGYDGIVISDDMEMKAVETNYTLEKASVLALQSGVDILLFSSTPQKQANAYNAVVAAVKAGELSEDAIDEKVLRILRLKQKYISIQALAES